MPSPDLALKYYSAIALKTQPVAAQADSGEGRHIQDGCIWQSLVTTAFLATEGGSCSARLRRYEVATFSGVAGCAGGCTLISIRLNRYQISQILQIVACFLRDLRYLRMNCCLA